MKIKLLDLFELFLCHNQALREAYLASDIVSEDLCSGPLQIHRCFYCFISFVLEVFFLYSLKFFVVFDMASTPCLICNHFSLKI